MENMPLKLSQFLQKVSLLERKFLKNLKAEIFSYWDVIAKIFFEFTTFCPKVIGVLP